MRTLLLPSALFLALVVAPMSAVAYTPLTDADGDEIEPNPYVTGNVTISNHKPVCADDVLCFHDDSNDEDNLASYGFAIDTERNDEPIQFSPAKVDVQYYGEDTDHKSVVSAWGANVSDKSWLETANWAASAAEGSGNEVFERVIRNGAHALHFKNVGAATPEADTYTLDFADITNDVTKLRLILGIEIVSISTESTVKVLDGNLTGTQNFLLSPSSSVKADGTTYYLTNGTGTVFWDELITEGDGTTAGGGVSGDVGKIQLDLYADSDVSSTEIYIYALGLQTSRFSFGQDDLGENVYNMTYVGCDGKARTAPLGYACLAEFAPSFDYQNVKDLKVAYTVQASTLPEDQVEIITSERDDDAFPWQTNYRFGFELPKMIDLTYAGDEAIKYVLPLGGAQHEKLEVGGVDKINDVEKKKVDDTVTLASSLTAGKETEIELTILFTEAQKEAITETGFLGAPESSVWSRFWAWVLSLPGVGTIAVALGGGALLVTRRKSA